MRLPSLFFFLPRVRLVRLFLVFLPSFLPSFLTFVPLSLHLHTHPFSKHSFTNTLTRHIATMSDQDNDKKTTPPTTKLAGLSLNPNTGAFVPRASAKSFVPSWMPPPAPAPAPAPPSSSGIDFNAPPPAAVLNKTVDTPPTRAAAAPNPEISAPRPTVAVSNKSAVVDRAASPAAPTPVPTLAPPTPRTNTPVQKTSSSAPKKATAAAAEAAGRGAEEADEDAVDQETLTEFFGKEHMNVIFIGHVDAGKSTMGGRIL